MRVHFLHDRALLGAAGRHEIERAQDHRRRRVVERGRAARRNRATSRRRATTASASRSAPETRRHVPATRPSPPSPAAPHPFATPPDDGPASRHPATPLSASADVRRAPSAARAARGAARARSCRRHRAPARTLRRCVAAPAAVRGPTAASCRSRSIAFSPTLRFGLRRISASRPFAAPNTRTDDPVAKPWSAAPRPRRACDRRRTATRRASPSPPPRPDRLSRSTDA